MNGTFGIDGAVALSGRDYAALLRTTIKHSRARVWCLQFGIDVRPDYDTNGEVRYLLHALAEAAHRGIDVRVALPIVPSPEPPVYDIGEPPARFLLARGVEVRRYRGTGQRPHCHAKLVVIDDDVVFCGNANWTARAFRINGEQVLAIRGSHIASAVAERFERVWRDGKRWVVEPFGPYDQVRFEPPVVRASPQSVERQSRRVASPSPREYWPPVRARRDPHERNHDRGRDLYAELMARPLSGAERASLLAGQQYVRRLASLFTTASNRIWIAMLGLRATTNEKLRSLLRALGGALARGVDVRILHEVRDGPRTDWTKDVGELQSMGATVRHWRFGGHLHSRSVLVDDTHAVVGSVGWTPQSIFNTEEQSLHVESRGVGDAIATRFLAWWDAASANENHSSTVFSRSAPQAEPQAFVEVDGTRLMCAMPQVASLRFGKPSA